MKIFLTILFLSFSAPVFAQAIDIDVKPIDQFEVKDVERLSVLLADIHKLPAKSLLEQTASASEIVFSLANTGDDLVRDRAVVASLRYWPSADAYLLAARLIANDSTRFATRVKTMLAFAEAFGDRAVPVVEVYLTNDDPQLQITAVQALAFSDKGFEKLTTLAKTTKDPAVLNAIKKYGKQLR